MSEYIIHHFVPTLLRFVTIRVTFEQVPVIIVENQRSKVVVKLELIDEDDDVLDMLRTTLCNELLSTAAMKLDGTTVPVDIRRGSRKQIQCSYAETASDGVLLHVIFKTPKLVPLKAFAAKLLHFPSGYELDIGPMYWMSNGGKTKERVQKARRLLNGMNLEEGQQAARLKYLEKEEYKLLYKRYGDS